MNPTTSVNIDGLETSVACSLLIDTSYSMSGHPIDQLNAGFAIFCEEIKSNPHAGRRIDIAVITFGGVARTEIPFTDARDLQPRRLTAHGSTPMGAALELALEETREHLTNRGGARGVVLRPWLFLITDGEPTDGPTFGRAVTRVREAEKRREISVFAVGVGGAADMVRLQQLSASRAPLMLDGLGFAGLFGWLASALRAASGEVGITPAEDGTAWQNHPPSLPPVGWARA